MTYPDLPAPVRRHSAPVPPLPRYGGRPAPQRVSEPVYPAAERYDEYGRPVAATGYADDLAPAYGQGAYAPGAYGQDDRYQHGYDPAFEETSWDSRTYDDADWDLHDRAHGDDGYAAARYADEGYADEGYGEDAYDDDYDGDWDEPDWGPRRTNRFAIWGLVCAFLLAPLGLVLSIIGLVQAGRRHERGRILAVLGLIVSIALIAFSVTVGIKVVNAVADRFGIDLLTGTSTADTGTADDAAGTAAAPAKPPGSVLEACNTLMPTLVALDDEMTGAATPQQVVTAVGKLKTAVLTATAAPDPAFQKHLNTLAGDLQTLIDATSTGQLPTGLEKTLESDAYDVGVDCGTAGWTG